MFGPDGEVIFPSQVSSVVNGNDVQVRTAVYNQMPYNFSENAQAVVSGAVSVSIHDMNGNELEVNGVETIAINVPSHVHTFVGNRMLLCLSSIS